MRTAKEMVDFCNKHETVAGGSKASVLQNFEIIEKNLLPDEEALVCFCDLHNFISATKHESNYSYALTNKRLIMA